MHVHANVSMWQRDHDGTYSAETNGSTLRITWQPEEPGKRRGFRWKVERDGKELATPDDIQESADALAAYIADPESRMAAGKAGREISKRFDWDTINGALLQRYRTVVARHSSKARA